MNPKMNIKDKKKETYNYNKLFLYLIIHGGNNVKHTANPTWAECSFSVYKLRNNIKNMHLRIKGWISKQLLPLSSQIYSDQQNVDTEHS